MNTVRPLLVRVVPPCPVWSIIVLLLLAVQPLAAQATNAAPLIQPDYAGITLPPNIAPLNFQVIDPGRGCRVTLRSAVGEPVTVANSKGTIRIPERRWREMLAANAGHDLLVEIQVREASGAWRALPVITNRIAREPLDGYLVYRRLRPLYNLYSTMGLYQRNLANFKQVEVLSNQRVNGSCLNCHTFCQNSPSRMFFHTRGVPGNPTILLENDQARQLVNTAGYAAWHPGGRFIVYSVNRLSLFFHTRGHTRDVFDADSDLNLFCLDTHTIQAPPAIARTNRLETWPAWSPDGRHLYFASAEALPQERFREVRYDLMRAAFNPGTGAWGEPETLAAAQDSRLSAAQPRVSPDGRWLVFTLFRYGNFPIYHANADLYLMDLATRQVRRLEINSDQADAWHGWSSNSRWLVFSSKRRDGVFTFPYFSYVNARGEFAKPFVLPQEDPAFYETCLQNFNLPELITTPVALPPATLAEAVLAPRQKIQPVPDPVHPPSRRQGTRGAAQ